MRAPNCNIGRRKVDCGAIHLGGNEQKWCVCVPVQLASQKRLNDDSDEIGRQRQPTFAHANAREVLKQVMAAHFLADLLGRRDQQQVREQVHVALLHGTALDAFVHLSFAYQLSARLQQLEPLGRLAHKLLLHRDDL